MYTVIKRRFWQDNLFVELHLVKTNDSQFINLIIYNVECMDIYIGHHRAHSQYHNKKTGHYDNYNDVFYKINSISIGYSNKSIPIQSQGQDYLYVEINNDKDASETKMIDIVVKKVAFDDLPIYHNASVTIHKDVVDYDFVMMIMGKQQVVTTGNDDRTILLQQIRNLVEENNIMRGQLDSILSIVSEKAKQ